MKMRLAREVVTQFHGAAAAATAEAEFVRVFQQQEIPEEMPEFRLAAGTGIIDAILGAGMAQSRSEARRLVEQGGVYIDGDRAESLETQVALGRDPQVLRVGRRRFARIVPG